ncbi:GNAT family N-acetyltransferase [Lactobacillus sp. LC28-10]|uniref:GNAT family N-acetyltransferase n=1 Tax=Secundilactobacillus angelensis TaxID=2722706 RepID=A0ABX1KXL1_9LACO|nr:GNAT family N-acetyltransferase [Secundilactobacillus angelensis]MCH5462155.1 GNAT family N-acetyltransferase [Secundilactobacillus angelensis]NLR18364.1 GNAT family N-acetyltransferase [Secundilactobacillus angelensis]
MAQEPELVIRQAVASDAQAVLNLLKMLKTESTTFEDSSDEVDPAAESEQIKQISTSKQQVILLALLDNELVGLVTVLPTAEHQIGEIGVAVLKKFWHQGIGRELMLSGLDWAALESDFDIITLTVQIRNQPAVRLYQDIGFQTIQTLKVTTATDEVVEALEMQLAVK